MPKNDFVPRGRLHRHEVNAAFSTLSFCPESAAQGGGWLRESPSFQALYEAETPTEIQHQSEIFIFTRNKRMLANINRLIPTLNPNQKVFVIAGHFSLDRKLVAGLNEQKFAIILERPKEDLAEPFGLEPVVFDPRTFLKRSP